MEYEPKPRPGSPNVVVIILDDVGFAQLGCFGSDIATPNIDRLAESGLRYNRFHVTALCSPTRAAFLTGRNHHAVGMGFLTQLPLNYPGYAARISRTAAPLPKILRGVGYSTVAIGKWHQTPRYQRSAAGPFENWPLGLGFERYYGFLQGDANHWAPDLIEDNHYLERQPEPGPPYHLTEDLITRARRTIVDLQNAAPGKPFFLYLALGAMHSPHHVAEEWVQPYHGVFDIGWDAWRELTFKRQIDTGIIPSTSQLTPRPPWVDAWNDVPQDHQRMYAHQQEVFAGFLSHTDSQIGKLVTLLEEISLLDNTLILLFSDNGASAEGGRFGSANTIVQRAEGLRESMDGQLRAFKQWGGPETYNHYSWAWAWAGNTPFRLWKRYTWLGGTRTPLIVHWPRRIAGGGHIRGQVIHAIDLMPTILDALEVQAPDIVDGVNQQPIDGKSFLASFTLSDAPSPRDLQYFEMLGSRSLISNHWKITTDHMSKGVVDEEELATTGSRQFENDHWSLFDMDTDFSESTDVSADHPDVVQHLRDLWFVEAGRNQVLPFSDDLFSRFDGGIPPAWPSPKNRLFHPESGPIFDESLPPLIGGFTFMIPTLVPNGGADGILFALGDWNGGMALFADAGYLVFTLAKAGGHIELVSEDPIPEGTHELGIRYEVTDDTSGRFQLLCDAGAIAEAELQGTFPPLLQYTSAGLRIGRDSGLPVSRRYRSPFRWTGEFGPLHLSTESQQPRAGLSLMREGLGLD